MRIRSLLLSITLLLLAISVHAATFPAGAPSTTSNDDSCDIGVFPAATLLLPYFEVDLGSAAGQSTTVFSITNTGRLPQAVRVTLWTDYGYPAFTFPVYLTGYDQQVINLFDVIARGAIAPEDGTGSDVSPLGELSRNAEGEVLDNPGLNEASCRSLAVNLPSIFVQRIRQAFTLGRIPSTVIDGGCENIGGAHAKAVGYATIDVVGSCDFTLPTQPSYFTSHIRYDNVLTGDYQQIDGANDFAQGGPLVHIRAISGGSSSRPQAPPFPRTFYGHLQPAASRTADRRQPLPSRFAARWIEGSGASFETFYKIWRGVDTAATATCAQYAANGQMPVMDIIRFDEEENLETLEDPPLSNPPSQKDPRFPATSLLNVRQSESLPDNTQGAVGGWMYFNLHNRGEGPAAQAWVTASMRSEGRFSVDTDAISLGNGCTPANTQTTGGRP